MNISFKHELDRYLFKILLDSCKLLNNSGLTFENHTLKKR